MATFGKITVGATGDASDTDKIIGSGPFTLTEEGDVIKISWHGYLITSAKNFRAGIYADSGGIPSGSLLGETQETQVGTSPQWWDFNFASPLHLTPGNYWLFVFQDAGGGTLKYYRESATAQLAYQMATYPNFPDPIVPQPLQDYVISIYATYIPSGRGILEVHAYEDSTGVEAFVEVVGVGTYLTPFNIDLGVGSYVLNATYGSHPTQTKTEEILDGAVTIVNFNFIVTKHILTVTSTPIEGIPFTIEKVI